MSCGGTKWKLLSKRRVQLPGYRFTNVSDPTGHIFQLTGACGRTFKGFYLKCTVVIFMYIIHTPLIAITILGKLEI